jgi:membrane protein required for beta-lactamase induction
LLPGNRKEQQQNAAEYLSAAARILHVKAWKMIRLLSLSFASKTI